MKAQIVLDRIYRAGHWFELGQDGQLRLRCESGAKPLTQPQRNAVIQHGPEIVRRAWRAMDDAKDLIERASARSRTKRQRRQETP